MLRSLSYLVETAVSPFVPLAERALKYRVAIAMFVATAPKDAKLQPLTQSDWGAIELVEEWLRLFREATTLMSTTSGITLSSVHSTFRELQDHVRDAFKSMPATAPPSLKQGLLNAHTKLSDYYLIFDASPYYVWAACEFFWSLSVLSSDHSFLKVLDPWINLAGLLQDCEQDDDPTTVEDQIRHVNACKAQLQEHFKRYYLPRCDPNDLASGSSARSSRATTLPDQSTPLVAPETPVQRRHFAGKARYRKHTSPSTLTGPLDELAAYFRLEPPSEDFPSDDPLKWWQSKEKMFPHLARLARDIFSIPGQ